MGLFDQPSWTEQMLRATEAQTKAAGKAQKAARKRAREDAATNAELLRLARVRDAREESEQRRPIRSDEVAARAAARLAAETRQRLQAQQHANWALFRQTPDGRRWQAWIEEADVLAGTLDRWNREWSVVMGMAAQQVRDGVQLPGWKLGNYLPASHPGSRVIGSFRVLAGIYRAAGPEADAGRAFSKFQTALAKKNPQWAAENEQCRAAVVAELERQVGFDPLVGSSGKVPGYLVGDLNWRLPDQYRTWIRYAQSEMPPASRIPVLGFALKPVDVFAHPELRSTMCALRGLL